MFAAKVCNEYLYGSLYKYKYFWAAPKKGNAMMIAELIILTG